MVYFVCRWNRVTACLYIFFFFFGEHSNLILSLPRISWFFSLQLISMVWLQGYLWCMTSAETWVDPLAWTTKVYRTADLEKKSSYSSNTRAKCSYYDFELLLQNLPWWDISSIFPKEDALFFFFFFLVSQGNKLESNFSSNYFSLLLFMTTSLQIPWSGGNTSRWVVCNKHCSIPGNRGNLSTVIPRL